MSYTKSCPDCRHTDFTGGDGRCKVCYGDGIDGFKSIADSFSTALSGAKGNRDCGVCSGTGQCQTCGGEGKIYVDDGNRNSLDSNYSSSSSYSGGSYSSETNEGCSVFGCNVNGCTLSFFGFIILLLVTIYFRYFSH